MGDASGHYDSSRTGPPQAACHCSDQLLDVSLTNYRELRLKLLWPVRHAQHPGRAAERVVWRGCGDRQRVKFIELVMALARDGAARAEPKPPETKVCFDR